MSKIKVLWTVFIAGNIYDVVVSFIAWYYHFIELNPIVSYFSKYGYFPMLLTLITLKIMAILGIYLILRKTNELLILTIVTIGSVFAVIWDTLELSLF